MTDLWVKVNLEQVFTGASIRLSELSTTLNKIKDEADSILLSYSEKADAAIDSLEVTANLIDDLTQAGFDLLMMAPASETFNNRIASALNKPTGDEFTAGLVLLVQAPSLLEAAEKYQALTDIITS